MNRKAQAIVESLFVMCFGLFFLFSIIKLGSIFFKKIQKEYYEEQILLKRLQLPDANQ